MTGKEATKRLGACKVDDTDKLDALAADIGSDSREPLSALTGAWARGAAEQAKAHKVLDALKGLPVAAWLRTAETTGGDRSLPALRAACAAYLQLQERAEKKLVAMLDSKTPVPPPPTFGPQEERRPKTRECDEAYLLLRHLLKADDTDEVRIMSEHLFLHMTDAERDREVRLYKEKQQWSVLAEEER
jgi:hypothetical protein